VEDNFLRQLVSEPTRGGALLDLLFTNREGLVGDVVVGGCLGLSDHEIIVFSVRGEVKRGARKTTTMDFWRADFGLFRMLVERVPWERVLKGKGVQAGWTFFKEDRIHPRVLRELAEELAKPLSIIYQQSWLTGQVPDDWRIASVTPIYMKGQKEDPGNYTPVSRTSVPGKIIKQLILSVLTRHVKDNQGIRPSQHGFMKGRSCLTNLISSYDQVTCLVDEG